MCADHYPLDRECDQCCGDHSLHWMLSKASSLLCDCHSPVWDRVCSSVVGVEAPRSGFNLQCEVRGTGTLPLGEESLSIPPQGLSTTKWTLWCHLSPIACTDKVHCGWHCLQPCLSLGNACNWPRCPLGTEFTKPLAQIHWSSAPTPAIVMHLDLGWELCRSAQTPAPPLHAHTHKVRHC